MLHIVTLMFNIIYSLFIVQGMSEK